jgi:sugar/nucleoside kinase (ribokinase family)
MTVQSLRPLVFLGEALVEVMRPGVDQPLDQIGSFVGPFPSGAPANAADAAARMGGAVTFIGSVGDDPFGKLFRDRMARDGIESSRIATVADATTGTAFVAYVSDGSRRFVFHLGAAGGFQSWQCQPEDLAGVRYVHITGSSVAFNTTWQIACLNVAKWAKENGAKVSLDPNIRAELAGSGRLAIAKIAEWCDVLLPSVGEAGLLLDCDDDAACRAYAARGKLVVQKRGRSGARVFEADGSTRDVPTIAVEEVDPTGAGDAFAGALLAGLQRGDPLDRALRLANICGALCVTKKGPMEGLPTRDEAIQLMEGMDGAGS